MIAKLICLLVGHKFNSKPIQIDHKEEPDIDYAGVAWVTSNWITQYHCQRCMIVEQSSPYSVSGAMIKPMEHIFRAKQPRD